MSSPSNKFDGDFVTSGSEADNDDLKKGHQLPPDPPAWLETIFEEQISENEQWDASKIRNFNPEDVSDQWGVIEDQKHMKILQDLNNPNIFRCVFKFNRISVDKILQVIIGVIDN